MAKGFSNERTRIILLRVVPKRRPVTAKELWDRLHADPEWVAARETEKKVREEHKKRALADQADLVHAIRGLGYDIESVWDLVTNAPHPVLERRFIGPYDRAYPVLIEHLQLPHMKGVREGIIRALTVADGGDLLEEALLLELRREEDDQLRWVIANALRVAMPYHRRRKHPEIKKALDWSGPT